MKKKGKSYVLLSITIFKGIDQYWSCDYIVTETLWNRSEKADHLAYKYWCVLQGSGIIKMIRNWPSLGKGTSTVYRKMYMGIRDIYPVRIDMITYQMYQLVGGFPAKCVASRVSQNIYFTWLVIRTSISFFERGNFQNWSIPLREKFTFWK